MSSNEWQRYKLGEIIDSIAMGPFGSNIKVDNFIPSGVPVIRGVNLNEGGFDEDNFVFISDGKAQSLKRSLALPDDLVFTHRGTIGQVGIIPQDKYPKYLVSQSQMKLTVNNRILNPMFLYYFIKSKIGQYELLKNSSQVGVPAIAQPTKAIKDINIAVPSMPIQNQIVEILTSLDGKIKLNRQTNVTLEAIAQAIFKEWFVDFNFPGASGEMVESELGMIPKGWRIGKLGEEGEFKNGINYSRDEKGNTEFYIVNVRNVVENKFINKDKLSKIFIDEKKATPYLLESDDVLIVRSASPGETAILLQAESKIIYSGFTIRYRLINKKYYLYIFFILQSIKNQLDNISNGTTLKNVNQEILKPYQILIPTENNIIDFNNRIQPIFELIQSLHQETTTLTEIRDLLLPKLMSGEIEV